ncbi:anti-sigma factor [Salibacterium qingdaonense]|uniref:Anti-sigma-W factor RsiW n=1 Tax=Salibacterium qingdaonense TaxID=266892 RepID=A0A1I4LF36_9BACI|nr:anti-sigma factor [Salibacterium qingdaonense]SFL89531.1 Putative zinc-finger [Salibacterium qingdaonense]
MENNTCHHLIDYINDRLTEEEKQAFEQHLQECETCREELQELEEAAGGISFHVKQVDPPDGLKGRVLGHVLEEEQKEEPARVTAKKTWSRTKTVGTALAAGLLLSLGMNIYTTSQLQNLSSENQELEQELSDTRTALSDLQEEESGTSPGAQESIQTAAFLPSDEGQSVGTAALVRQNDSAELLVQAQNLEALTNEEVYQVWLFEDGTPVPAGSFTTDEAGVGGVLYKLENRQRDWDAVAVSKEPQPGNEQPQGEVVMQAEWS